MKDPECDLTNNFDINKTSFKDQALPSLPGIFQRSRALMSTINDK